MSSFKEVALRYLQLLELGDMADLLTLFHSDAIVISPIYGRLEANIFYRTLAADTKDSTIQLKSIFHGEKNNELAIYFNYNWTLQNGEKVIFDVVDVMYFDDANKIIELHIIYDASTSKKIVDDAKK